MVILVMLAVFFRFANDDFIHLNHSTFVLNGRSDGLLNLFMGDSVFRLVGEEFQSKDTAFRNQLSGMITDLDARL